MKKMIKCVLVCALLTGLVWCGTVIADRERLNKELIRLHVVANSDTAEDQNLKLLVRDAVITSLRQALADVQDTQQAKEYLEENLPKLQELANKTLDAAGSTQRAVVTLCREGFPTRQYDTFSLPAGVYEALRITIGEGEGKNWWCVVFPSLCLPRHLRALPILPPARDSRRRYPVLFQEKNHIRSVFIFWISWEN